MSWRVDATGLIGMFVDGISIGFLDAGGGLLAGPTALFIGSARSTLGFWTGDLLEIVAYDRELKGIERNMIHAYFSARSGTPSPRALFTFGATHGGDVAGITDRKGPRNASPRRKAPASCASPRPRPCPTATTCCGVRTSRRTSRLRQSRCPSRNA